MILVRISDIPLYLHEGGFYQGLDLEKSDESVSVPGGAVKSDETVRNQDDLLHLLTSLQFWAISRLPKSIIVYIIFDSSFTVTPELDSFLEAFPMLKDLLHVRSLDEADARTKYAIEHGLTEVVRHFHESGVPFMISAASFAAYAEQLEVLQYLVSIGCRVDNLTGAFAAQAGSTKCLAYLLTLMPFNNRTINTAAAAGQVECLKVLYEFGYRGSVETATSAAMAGKLNSLVYLHEQKCDWNEFTCSEAAKGGHLECLKFLHENGCPWDVETPMDAAAEGHLDCLIYSHTQGAPIHAEICHATAVRGHLECLKYAHEHNFPWREIVCSMAAQHGMLHTLTYAHEHGCPWNGDVTHYAAAYRRYDCLRYAVEQGCVWDEARFEEYLLTAPTTALGDAVRDDLKRNCAQS